MKLNIDNKEYTLNVERAVELKVLTPVVPPVIHKVGNFYKTENGSIYFILAAVGGDVVTLIPISMYGGNRWRNPIQVINSNNITTDEWNEIAGSDIIPVPKGEKITINN